MLHRKQMPAARSRNIWVNRWQERSIRLSPWGHGGHGPPAHLRPATRADGRV